MLNHQNFEKTAVSMGLPFFQTQNPSAQLGKQTRPIRHSPGRDIPPAGASIRRAISIDCWPRYMQSLETRSETRFIWIVPIFLGVENQPIYLDPM